MKNYLQILKHCSLFRGLGVAEIEQMLGCLQWHKAQFEKGDIIMRAFEVTPLLGVVLEGNAVISSFDYYGNSNIIAALKPGDLFAEAYACSGEKMGVNVYALGNCTVLFLDVRKLMASCASVCDFHGRVIRNLTATLAGKNLALNNKLSHVSQRTTRQKLLSYLLFTAESTGSRSVTIPFNRTQLADYLAVERSAMSAELGRMQRDGILTVQKNSFTLL